MTSPLWKFFYRGGRQNNSHFKAYCIGCISTKRPEHVPFEENWEAGIDIKRNENLQWFRDACDAVDYVRGDTTKTGPMVRHLLGGARSGDRCENVTKEARAAAQKIQGGTKEPETSDEEDSDGEPSAKRRRTVLHKKATKHFEQTTLSLVKGVNMPFTDAQAAAIEQQFGRATVSANLPFRWVENVEVLRLFYMMRTTALDIIPSRKVLAGRILGGEGDDAENELLEFFRDQYVTLSTDGWKCMMKNAIVGVNLVRGGRSRLVKLFNSNSLGKDGPSMQRMFEQMVDHVERKYGSIVVFFATDNDGGSHAGRDGLAEARPWIGVAPCVGHQGQLINGDLFKVSPEAEAACERATEIVGWLHRHGRVRELFYNTQLEARASGSSAPAKSYLVGNQTRWTTHTIAFQRLIDVQTSLRHSAVFKQDEIVAAQVGAEKRKKQRAELQKSARTFIQYIDDGPFWTRLALVVEDLKPITYMTNINQADDMRLDQSVLSLAGVFLHFAKHSDTNIKTGMTKRIEVRWKALDQPLFILTLVLNPYEMLSRFGDKANIDVFVLNSELLQLYSRFNSHPSDEPLTPDEEAARNTDLQRRKKELSKAFFQYIGDSGPFVNWSRQRDAFREAQDGDDPALVWAQFTSKAETKVLAEFALMLLGICCNQGGNERTFSDLRLKQSRLRNRLSLKKLEVMSKIGDKLRFEHERDGLTEVRAKRKVHDHDRVTELLAVPRYADVLGLDEDGDEDDTSGKKKVGLITTKSAWRIEVAKWKAEALDELDLSSDDEDDAGTNLRREFFPRSLKLLFGGAASRPASSRHHLSARAKQAHSEEALRMELLAAAYDSEEPDDGELEGSGDDFEP